MSVGAKRSKLLLMGKSGSGKTSMRSVIFAKDTRRLGATIDVDQSSVRFLGSLVLNLWDCGGQNSFVDNYLSAQRDTIFAGVAVLIYVFDMTSNEWDEDMRYFEDILSALREHTGDAGVWVLLNKMDLADKEDPERKKFQERKAEIMGVEEKVRAGLKMEKTSTQGGKGGVRVFPTSIYDETLYKAWSSVVHTLIPNVTLITDHLTYLRDLCLAVEVVLFETETFLVIAKSGSPVDSAETDMDETEQKGGAGQLNVKRFEKISEIVKGFRKTCQKSGEQWLGFESTFGDCRVVVEPMTKNSFGLVISTDPRIETALLQYNMNMSRPHLADFAMKSQLDRKCGICRNNTDLKYQVEGDDDPSLPAWDDPITNEDAVV